MNKLKMKNKIIEIQSMSEAELNDFENKLCVSDLEMFKKELLFKAIDIRKNRHLQIKEALVEMEEMREGDEDEL